MKGITFNNLQEAKEYQIKMSQQGHLTERTRIPGAYKVTITGKAPEWKNDTKVNNVSDAIKDEDELP